jgi:hypothetical protein
MNAIFTDDYAELVDLLIEARLSTLERNPI